MHTYILDSETGEARLALDLLEWAQWYIHADESLLLVANDAIRSKWGKVLAIVDTRFDGKVELLTAEPLVWVTRVVGTCEITRTRTRKEAAVEHQRMLRLVRSVYKKQL